MPIKKKLITREFLESKRACEDGKEWCLSHGELTVEELFFIFLEHKKYEWCNLALVQVMTKKQQVTYAIFAAEQVLHIFEEKNPDAGQPRKAIEAAKAYLKNPCARTKKAAAHAAYAAADASAGAAAHAADAAAHAADASAGAAAHAADAAVSKEKMYISILSYGFGLLK